MWVFWKTFQPNGSEKQLALVACNLFLHITALSYWYLPLFWSIAGGFLGPAPVRKVGWKPVKREANSGMLRVCESGVIDRRGMSDTK